MKYRWPLLFLILLTALAIFWRPLTFRIKVYFLLQEATAVAEQANRTDQSMGVEVISKGVKLVIRVSKLDRASAVDPARMLMRRSIVLWPDWKTFIMSSGHDLARYIPQLTEIRVEGGDTNALAEYAAWIKTIDEEKIDQYSVEAFEPLWRNPNDPAVQTASDWLFNDSNSPWSKLPWCFMTFNDPFDSKLVKLPSFRRLLLKEINDISPIGSLEWVVATRTNITLKLPGANGGTRSYIVQTSGGFSYQLTNGSGGFRGFIWPDTNSPVNGDRVTLRRCDWIAWKLSSTKQIPFYNPYDSREKCDEAISNAATTLLDSKP